MIREIKANELDCVLEYLKSNLQLCLYAYIDIKKYGLDNPNLTVYAHFDDNNSNEIHCVIMKYFKGLQIYTGELDYDAKELVEFLEKIEFNMINGASYLIEAIAKATPDTNKYESEKGFVVELTELKWNKNKEVASRITEAMTDVEFFEAAELICSDEGLGGHYEIKELADQLQSRSEDKFGRNLLLRQNNKLVCHVATYAEVEEVGVVSGVITDTLARGQGLAYQLVGALCEELLKENKRVFLFYYTETAGKLYKKLGFGNEQRWEKLIVK